MPRRLAAIDLSAVLPRLSLKAGLAVYLPVGLLFFLLSRSHSLLIHTLVELANIALLSAMFLIGWNTRNLVRSQFFVILTAGCFAAGLVDLLQTLTYRGMQVAPAASADMAIQLWLVGRTLGAFAFLCAILSLGRKDHFTAKEWLLGFLLSAAGILALIWPVGIFPTCFAEGSGLTAFKTNCEYFIIGLLFLAAALLWSRKQHLNRHIVALLLLAIGLSVCSELLLALFMHLSDFINFLGHYLKLGSAVLVYYALVEGTLRSPFEALFRDVGQSYEELNRELQRRVTAEKKQEVAHREASLLYQLSRAMHSTLNLDELAHLTLSAATGVEAGGFERATLFTVNKRTGMLQGMLGVSLDMASMVLPAGENFLAWEQLRLDEQSREAQRLAPFNQKVVKQRLILEKGD
ncbi:MAG: hypothetical protein OEL80_01265, partial [Desulfuromonadales bacterium]|nr:hypothetical protein [Desulfuromonadales bacterium]